MRSEKTISQRSPRAANGDRGAEARRHAGKSKPLAIVFGALIFLLTGHASQATASEAVCEVPDRGPKVLHRQPPPYPYAALSFCIEGRAEFEFTVGVDGSVSNIVVKDSQPAGVFDRSGEIFLAWKFQPACADGSPVEHIVTMPIDFELEGFDDRCPENLPDNLVEMLIALHANHAEASRQIETRTHPLVDLPLESRLDEPFASLEIAHRMFLNGRLDMEREWRNVAWDLIRLGASPDSWRETRDAIQAREFLLGLFDRRRQVRQRWPEILKDYAEEMDRIEREFEIDPLARSFLLAGNQQAIEEMLEEHRQIVMIENTLYERYLELVEWFIENDQDWAVETDGLVFAASALEDDYQRRRREIRELETEWFEQFELPSRITFGGF